MLYEMSALVHNNNTNTTISHQKTNAVPFSSNMQSLRYDGTTCINFSDAVNSANVSSFVNSQTQNLIVVTCSADTQGLDG